MLLNQDEQDIFLNKLKEELSALDFGQLYCKLVISEGYLMYVDFKREKNERLYIHIKPENKGGEENE
jgi:hypothetical protein